EASAEVRRLRTRLAEVEAALETARRSARDARGAADVRLRLLLDTVAEAAHAALPPRALDEGDPARLDALLALPRVHLVVDGYNVTKTGYGGLPLADQRARLVGALATL